MKKNELTEERLNKLLNIIFKQQIHSVPISSAEWEQAHTQLTEIVKEHFKPPVERKLLAVNIIKNLINSMDEEKRVELRDKLFPQQTPRVVTRECPFCGKDINLEISLSDGIQVEPRLTCPHCKYRIEMRGGIR